MKDTIYIVEDEPDISELMSLNIENAGLSAVSFPDIAGFRSALSEKKPSLVILDIMLPDGDGMELCKELKKERSTANMPVIMVTARGDEIDRVLGLELGADDYITKPFSPRELVARVKNVLRRNLPDGSMSEDDMFIDLGSSLSIDVRRHQVMADGEYIDLTATEFNILVLLSRRKGWVFTREQILDHLWGDDKAVTDRTIDVHVNHLREKLGPHGGLLKNIRGVGYKLDL